eukprot:7189454-Prymnesium_polylepis.2
MQCEWACGPRHLAAVLLPREPRVLRQLLLLLLSLAPVNQAAVARLDAVKGPSEGGAPIR